MEKTKPIIVIGRSFGAGGRSIGKCISDRTGIPFYDNEILQEVAEEFGFSKSIFARADEKRPSRFRRIVSHAYGIPDAYMADALGPESLYQAQSQAIRAIAMRGPCIIIGRTADYILRDFTEMLSVFLHAPLSFRAIKIVERGDAENEVDAIEMARQKDRRRQEYYNYFTGRHWGEASNYDLTLDSSIMPNADIAEFIIDFYRKRDNYRVRN